MSDELNPVEAIVAYVTANPGSLARDIKPVLGMGGPTRWSYYARVACNEGKIHRVGNTKSARYYPGPKPTAAAEAAGDSVPCADVEAA